MVARDRLLEQITNQIAHLPFNKRLLLLHQIIDTLRPAPDEAQQQYLVYGQFRSPRMSTEEDFYVAEWRPTEQELNGV
jgi:hypothetical protein